MWIVFKIKFIRPTLHSSIKKQIVRNAFLRNSGKKMMIFTTKKGQKCLIRPTPSVTHCKYSPKMGTCQNEPQD
jgi:hypothetical protein